jgi:hypothetical protein
MEFRGTDGRTAIPNRALDGAIQALSRSEGSTSLDATLVRLTALRIRENAFIQIDPLPPLGTVVPAAEFERSYADRLRDWKTPKATR